MKINQDGMHYTFETEPTGGEPKYAFHRKYQRNFESDRREAKKTEREWATFISPNVFAIWFNDDYRYDVGTEKANGKVFLWEVKDDTVCAKTGNVGVEFECCGKASGIRKTQAHGWVFRLYDGWWWIPTSRLKAMIREKQWVRIGENRDPVTPSKMYLFKEARFKMEARKYDAESPQKTLGTQDSSTMQTAV